MDYDQTEIAQTYDKGRDHGPAFLQLWMTTVEAHVDAKNIQRILDLGCGTGRFSAGLANYFSADVIGVDPSKKMLAQANHRLKHARLSLVRGAAETLPMVANSVDLVFISMVFHHFVDPQHAALECWRVLRPGGRVFLRTGCREKIPLYPYVPFFPGSRVLLDQRLPSLATQCAPFEAASFRVLHAGVVTQEIAPNYPAYAEKLASRSDSILIDVDDAEFEAGIQSLKRAVDSGPVVEPIDFVVMEK